MYACLIRTALYTPLSSLPPFEVSKYLSTRYITSSQLASLPPKLKPDPQTTNIPSKTSSVPRTAGKPLASRHASPYLAPTSILHTLRERLNHATSRRIASHATCTIMQRTLACSCSVHLLEVKADMPPRSTSRMQDAGAQDLGCRM